MNSKKDILRALGIVFGDIGTSPIYTLAAVLLLSGPEKTQVFGIISLIIWTLILVVTVQYAWLAMSLSRNGEGGTIVLREILLGYIKKGRSVSLIVFLSFLGISLIVGDGVITPAISILSAVEGIPLIPGLASIGHGWLLLITCVIAIWLFSIQKKGTDKVGAYFGPIMIVWFLALSAYGIFGIVKNPEIIRAINPVYAIEYLIHHGLIGFYVLSEVILCATGGEALYADMGHLGRRPIVKAWYFVFAALLLNYLGQGAFVLASDEVKGSVLFALAFNASKYIYIPFLILSIIATIIASQAMISGMFSIIYQAITTRILPMLKVTYTSSKVESQIYIGTVNYLLLFAVICVVFIFQTSANLSVAYGLAVTGTMTLTAFFMAWIFKMKNKKFLFIVATLLGFIDAAFLMSNLQKLHHGGYWSIIIAAFPFLLILLYTKGQKRLYKNLRPIPFDKFRVEYREAYDKFWRIRDTAFYFVKDLNEIPPYVHTTMMTNKILYSESVFISAQKHDDPFGLEYTLEKNVEPGLHYLVVKFGYMQFLDFELIFKEINIEPSAIFYGIEDIETDSIIWEAFSILKKITPSFVKFYKLPSNKLHGVMSRFEI